MQTFRLHSSVLDKLPADFDRQRYLDARAKYATGSTNSNEKTFGRRKEQYVTEKRKVLLALTFAKNGAKSVKKAQTSNEKAKSADNKGAVAAALDRLVHRAAAAALCSEQVRQEAITASRSLNHQAHEMGTTPAHRIDSLPPSPVDQPQCEHS